MSQMLVSNAVSRIEEATPASPIAIFRCDTPGRVAVAFAATARTQALIKSRVPSFIGVFHAGDDPYMVRARLDAAARIA